MDGIRPISRDRTAITRPHLSKPISLAVADGILTHESSLFDYGCGRGDDVTRMRALGYKAHGWDPGHHPDADIRAADVVNLGYVVNVIEDPAERAHALRSAWSLAKNVLIVAARPDWEARTVSGQRHGDGIITGRGTFQRFFTQEDLRSWINDELEASCIAAAPGIFYVFREEARAQSFLASRIRQRPVPVRHPKIRQDLFDAHRDALEELSRLVTSRGRLPEPWELTGPAGQLLTVFPSIKRAAAMLREAVGAQDWDKDVESARHRAADDLLVYLALAAFTGRPKVSNLPRDIALDVKALFGSYRAACDQADHLLHSVADQEALNAACGQSHVGKLTADALYVHTSALDSLSPLLRVYEGCARALTGTVAEATLIKFSRTDAKVSYLAYPDFDRDPHPALQTSLRADLRRLHVKYLDFRDSANPPVLHRKETFVPVDYPAREKFARLTRQEERAGLLDVTSTIGTRNGWQRRLDDLGYQISGHRISRIALTAD
ncbi:DNA phosphorothioation-associated putative methyltransferase [Dactylosporangium sp. NPDC005572]|uniref:DNA phosphorothioation-associated putative methyltransferase n=1 Tax=Dactylosporangium sp. NPDC005572 TaxID=3156889 RepID=UPI0033AD86A8